MSRYSVSGFETFCSDDGFLRSPRSNNTLYHKSLVASKSSPSLCNTLQTNEKCSASSMVLNISTANVSSPPFLNPHKALIELYKKFSGNKGSSFVRSLSVRNKRLKKLEDIYTYCNEENTFIVEIKKSSNGLGMCIYGGKDAAYKDPFHHLIRIWNLHPSQPALECGKLTLGDVILEVNGISVLGMTNAEAVEVLRSAPIDVTLKIFRPSMFLIPPFSGFKESLCSDDISHCNSAKSGSFCPVNFGELKVTLMKRDGCLGFSIVRKDNTSDLTGGIFVKALTRKHAVSDGRIKAGDRILQVNGTDISTFSHTEAVAFLRNTPEMVTLKLCRSCSGSKFCAEHSLRKVQTFNVIFEKCRNEHLGFCVWNSIESGSNIQKKLLPCAAEVKVVYPGSLAHKNGIKVGDRILEVNGENLLAKTADEVLDILRKVNGVIRMVFCRLQ